VHYLPMDADLYDTQTSRKEKEQGKKPEVAGEIHCSAPTQMGCRATSAGCCMQHMLTCCCQLSPICRHQLELQLHFRREDPAYHPNLYQEEVEERRQHSVYHNTGPLHHNNRETASDGPGSLQRQRQFSPPRASPRTFSDQNGIHRHRPPRSLSEETLAAHETMQTEKIHVHNEREYPLQEHVILVHRSPHRHHNPFDQPPRNRQYTDHKRERDSEHRYMDHHAHSREHHESRCRSNHRRSDHGGHHSRSPDYRSAPQYEASHIPRSRLVRIHRSVSPKLRRHHRHEDGEIGAIH
jgi:hypothetical protein